MEDYFVIAKLALKLFNTQGLNVSCLLPCTTETVNAYALNGWSLYCPVSYATADSKDPSPPRLTCVTTAAVCACYGLRGLKCAMTVSCAGEIARIQVLQG